MSTRPIARLGGSSSVRLRRLVTIEGYSSSTDQANAAAVTSEALSSGSRKYMVIRATGKG